ncbi:hypothetical protein DL95DRAFT_489824 [Leptodontidium sp. 2 PMI_412]|nr:hypothetical protein DL95DRAFT_489824 [Leptodontidium sp. 2 PMI_412]
MLFFQLILAVLSVSLFNLTLAHGDQNVPSSSDSPTLGLSPLENVSQIPNSLESLLKPVFTFTPPFASQTFVSISLPLCLPHDPTLSPLGCREPSTSLSPANTLAPSPTPTTLVPQATNVVWKTVLVTVTRTSTVWRSSGNTFPTYAYKNKGRRVMDWKESATQIRSEDQVTTEAITTIISILDTNHVPEKQGTTSPPTPTDKENLESTTTPPIGYGQSNVPHHFLPGTAPIPFSANSAQSCFDLEEKTDIAGVGDVLPTESVLHSTNMIIDPGTTIKCSLTTMTPKESPILSPNSDTSSASSSTASSITASNSNDPSTQTTAATSTGLRKMEHPYLLLAACAAGAMLYEMGVWSENGAEEGKDAKDDKNKKGDKTKKAGKEGAAQDANNAEGSKSDNKAKENDALDKKKSEESLSEWNLV